MLIITANTTLYQPFIHSDPPPAVTSTPIGPVLNLGFLDKVGILGYRSYLRCVWHPGFLLA